MRYPREPWPRRRVPEREVAHPAAIETAVHADRACAERRAYRRDRLASRAREPAGDLVGIDHGDPAPGEQIRDHAFSAADAARESDGESHRRQRRYQSTICRLQHMATIPAMAR